MYTCTLYMVSCTLYTAQTPHAKIEGERIHVHLGEGILAIIYSICNRRSQGFFCTKCPIHLCKGVKFSK